MDMIAEKPKSTTEQVLDRIAELVIQASEADRQFVNKIRKPEFFGNAETVTPIQAALILEANSHNRRLSNAQFDLIMGILMRGEWKRTHQGIAFYENGDLMDGQHRLGGCVLSGIPLSPIMISGGYGKDDNDAIDAGAKRTAADATTLAGVSDAALKCTIVEQWMKYEHLMNYGKGITFTNHQVKVKAIQHDAALANAIALADAVLKTCAIAVMSKREIAARAFEMVQGGWSPAYVQDSADARQSGNGRLRRRADRLSVGSLQPGSR